MGNPTIVTQDFDYGPAEQVTYNDIDLGALMGNVTVRLGYEVLDRMAHQYGISPLSSRIKGHTIEVDLVLAEFTPANINKAIQGGTLAGDEVSYGALTGQELTYGELEIYPYNQDRPHLIIYRAAPVAAVDFVIGEEQAGVKVTFRGYIDVNRTLGDQLYKFGEAGVS